MSDKPKDAEASQEEQSPPDGRGPRPTDPNELAKWIVDQTTQGHTDKAPEQPEQ